MKFKILTLSMFMLIITSCSSLPTAPKINGNPIVLQIFIEDNIHQKMDNNEVKRYSQLSSWMADDLISLLEKSGYLPKVIREKSEYKYSKGIYLLEVKVEQYNFRAVGTFLAVSYILEGEQTILSSQHSTSTKRNWRHCVQKLNKDMVDAVTKKFVAMDNGKESAN